MGKTFHYLAGLHRSGNTVLSAILNQHPEIYSAPLGPICEYMWLVHDSFHETTIINTDGYRKTQLISKMMESYYSDVEKPIIIDRDKNWGHPGNVNMLKTHVNKNPKIIYTTRPIAEVIASYIAINTKGILNEMQYFGWPTSNNKSINDNMCDFLMRPDGQFMRSVTAADSINDPENAGMFHIVRYRDLLDSPQKTMDGIYDFLGISSFEHNFYNIQKLETYDDTKAGLPKDLHKVRKTLSKGDVIVDEYVSKSIQEKYAHLDELIK